MTLKSFFLVLSTSTLLLNRWLYPTKKIVGYSQAWLYPVKKTAGQAKKNHRVQPRLVYPTFYKTQLTKYSTNH